MAASRWNTNYTSILRWIEDGDEEATGQIANLTFADMLQDTPEGFAEDAIEASERSLDLPEELPILPLRGLVVYPQTVVPLTVGQPRSIRLIDDAVSDQRMIGLVTSKDPDLETPGPEQLYQVGTVATIHRLFRAPDGTIRLLVQGLGRFTVDEYTQTEPYIQAKITARPEVVETGLEVEALARNARDQFEHIAEMIPSIPREVVASITAITDPLQTVYTIANFQRMDLAEAQAILEMDTISDKLRRLVGILTRESEVLDLGQKIQNEARSEIEKVQRDYFLREQLKAIQKELGEGDEQTADVEDFRRKIAEANMPEEAAKQAQRELSRLSRLPTAAAEYGVIRTYLDWLTSVPWSKTTPDNLDITNARTVLDEDHYGLKDVKDRILEYLAVRKLRLERKNEEGAEPATDRIRREREGVILCFVGPPGVGKTSLGQSIARALGRKFIRVSLGGIRDEAEIRGHRRTYIGAMPGRIIQALRRIESKNPVFMLDEIDKLSFDFHGDPGSALLEVLDPEQNLEFRDNYMEVAYDLSQVMFITTANQLSTIPAPLLDRMEVIQIAGYTEGEKMMIAKRYLVPRQLRENGLHRNEVTFTDEALQFIVRNYTREAGVRELERQIGGACRKVVTRIAEGKNDTVAITAEMVRELLGRPRYIESEEVVRRTSVPGVATGLAWTPVGGEILFIEATRMPGNKGFMITGSVGDVMRESAQAALSYVRAHADELHIDPAFFEKSDIHLHIPAGATPKDGPSAGITMTTALVSLLTQHSVSPSVGMTGEISLRGQVLPVGGIKEKMLAAKRAGLKTVFLPRGNAADLDDLPQEVRDTMRFLPVDTVSEVLEHAFEEPLEGLEASQKEMEQPENHAE